MRGRRSERFFYVLLGVVALVAVAVMIWKAEALGWSESTTGMSVPDPRSLDIAGYLLIR